MVDKKGKVRFVGIKIVNMKPDPFELAYQEQLGRWVANSKKAREVTDDEYIRWGWTYDIGCASDDYRVYRFVGPTTVLNYGNVAIKIHNGDVLCMWFSKTPEMVERYNNVSIDDLKKGILVGTVSQNDFLKLVRVGYVELHDYTYYWGEDWLDDWEHF